MGSVGTLHVRGGDGTVETLERRAFDDGSDGMLVKILFGMTGDTEAEEAVASLWSLPQWPNGHSRSCSSRVFLFSTNASSLDHVLLDGLSDFLIKKFPNRRASMGDV